MSQNKSREIPKQTANFDIRKSILLIISLVLFFAFLLSLVFGAREYRKSKDLTSKLSLKDIQADKTDYIKVIGKLMELPNEVPTLATVSDKNKLANQPFFKNAQNGDKVLIYSQAKKAILYRPATNKIIEVSTITVNTPSEESSASATPAEKKVKVIIYNGTKIAGKAGSVKNQITSTFPQIEVVKTGNAKNDYAATYIYDVTGMNKDLTSSLAKALGGSVATSRSAEIFEGADVFIVLGK